MPSARFQPAFTSGVLGPALWGLLSSVIRVKAKLSLRFVSCGYRIGDMLKSTEKNAFVINSDLRNPRFISWGEMHPGMAACVGRRSPAVFQVLSPADHPQVVPSVVCPVSVDVVNVAVRPTASLMRPRDSVRIEQDGIYAPCEVAVQRPAVKGRIADVRGLPALAPTIVWQPGNNPGASIVAEALTQFFRRGKGLLSHAMLQSSVWSGGGRCVNSFRPRHHTLIATAIQDLGVSHAYC